MLGPTGDLAGRAVSPVVVAYRRLRFCGVLLLVFVAVPLPGTKNTAPTETAAAQTKLVRQPSAHPEISTMTLAHRHQLPHLKHLPTLTAVQDRAAFLNGS